MNRASYDNRHNLIAEYLLAIKKPRTVDQIRDYERNGGNHKIWGLWMDAMAHFKLSKKYFSLDDVPESQKVLYNIVEIRTPGKLTQYTWDGEKWRMGGAVHDEFYKM